MFSLYVGFVGALLFAAAGWWVSNTYRRRCLQPRLLLTATEDAFLETLERALPELRFHAQVSMQALLQPTMRFAEDPKGWARARRLYASKVIDFVAQRRDTGEVLCIIELDDHFHDARKDEDRARDAMLLAAGFVTLRWDCRDKPNSGSIRRAVLAAFPQLQGSPGDMDLSAVRQHGRAGPRNQLR